MPDASLLSSLFPDEVVTRALVRDVELPYGAGTMALITLDNGRDHTRPSTFGPAGLLALGDALDAVAARTDITAVAFPECFLGLLPGWGGTYLLPHLIGPGNALKLIVENPLSQNRMLRGAQAFSLGIADAMFEPADFLAESLRWAARVLTGA